MPSSNLCSFLKQITTSAFEILVSESNTQKKLGIILDFGTFFIVK